MSVAYKPEFPFPSVEAFGKPGAEPRWSRASKHGVGTALSALSKVWFTIESGIITEVYYPTVGTANTRDLKFLISDGKTFFDEEGKDTEITAFEYIHEKAPAYLVTHTAKSGLYSITKRIITDPQANALVVNCSFKALRGVASDFRLYALLAPHIKNMGFENSGRTAVYGRRSYLIAWRENITAALASDHPFIKMSAGFSGSSDGWQDLHDNLDMDWAFERAENGNIALTGEIQPRDEFTLVLGFGKDEVEAVLEAEKSLSRDYHSIEREYIRAWRRYINSLDNLGRLSPDGGRRFFTSAMVLKTHEDKTFPGAVIASLSIPWGETKGDGQGEGYHLVWPRDLCKTAFAFMAMGDGATALSILQYLQNTQTESGSWPQNMHINGLARWPSVQLDEVALPVILAWRLRGMGMTRDDFYPMAKKAAAYIATNGPVTRQERWEERSGLSPSTLAAEITALVCAAHWARQMGETKEADYLFSTADYWQTRLEDWTYRECNCLGEGIPGHYMQIVSEMPETLDPEDQVCHAVVFNRNRPADRPHHQGAIVDAGFLDLVRYGVRSARDPRILDSLKSVDKLLRFENKSQVAFYRYNFDGYGEKEDGSAFDGSGVGRPWPLLTGERGVYEAMAEVTPEQYLDSLESFANDGFMFPEQIWDSDDIPGRRLQQGKGTGSATPLVWAHAEYIKALRTIKEAWGCDLVDEVKTRYVDKITKLRMTAWKKGKLISTAQSSETVRIICFEPASLLWTSDNWTSRSEEAMNATGLGIWHLDFAPGSFAPGSVLAFTFHYPEKGGWEGANYEISIN